MDDWTKEATKELLYLRKEVQRLKGIERQYKGLLTELRVQTLIPGSHITAISCSDGDIITLSDERIEVKFSSNTDKRLGIKWDWNHIYGMTGKKKFDKLVLIGGIGNGYKYFSMGYWEIPKGLLTTFKKGHRISLRYSTKSFSKYMKYLAQFECQPYDIKSH